MSAHGSPTVFYAWQSDSDPKLNRNFIQRAAEDALKEIAIASTIEDSPRPVLDHDTKGETGSPEIAQTIFGKIDKCMAMLADVSLVGSITTAKGQTKHTPNPNVLIELGYAAKSRGWDRIITVVPSLTFSGTSSISTAPSPTTPTPGSGGV